MLELDSFDEVHLRIYKTPPPRSGTGPKPQVKILPTFEEELAWIRSKLDTDDPRNISSSADG